MWFRPATPYEPTLALHMVDVQDMLLEAAAGAIRTPPRIVLRRELQGLLCASRFRIYAINGVQRHVMEIVPCKSDSAIDLMAEGVFVFVDHMLSSP